MLTDEGRRRGLALLGVDRLPPKAKWDRAKKVYLPALAMGLPAPKGTDATNFGKKDGFEPAVLKVGYGLAVGDFPTDAAATGALIWKLLGIDTTEPLSIGALKKYIFNRELGDQAARDKETAIHRLVARTVDARRDDPAELRLAAVRRWVDGRPVGPGQRPAAAAPVPSSSPAVAAKPLPLEEFARRVVLAARACPTGWFGNNKVFIAHVWRALQDDPAFRGMDIVAFKKHLTEANQSRLLNLSRADLVEAMDPEDVRSSETLHLGAAFHFVRL